MKTDRVTVRLTPEQAQFLQMLSKESGLDISKIIRYILDDKIQSLKN